MELISWQNFVKVKSRITNIGIIQILWQRYPQQIFGLDHSFSTTFKYNNLPRNSINSSARTLKIDGFQLFIWYKRTLTFHHCAIILVALEPWILTLLSLYPASTEGHQPLTMVLILSHDWKGWVFDFVLIDTSYPSHSSRLTLQTTVISVLLFEHNCRTKINESEHGWWCLMRIVLNVQRFQASSR